MSGMLHQFSPLEPLSSLLSVASPSAAQPTHRRWKCAPRRRGTNASIQSKGLCQISLSSCFIARMLHFETEKLKEFSRTKG